MCLAPRAPPRASSSSAGVSVAGALSFVFLAGPLQRDISVLSFRVGQSFGEVVRASSYPVLERQGNPGDREDGFGWTDITEPVTLRFNDPVHGFVLPPTKFVAVTYADGNVATVSTTPMLDALPFDEAVTVLENLQNQFKAGGWEPWKDDDSAWFDLSPEGRKRLHARMFEPGYMQQTTLRVPETYAMTFRFKCAEGCWTQEPPYRFLIDVGVGGDSRGPGQPMIWEKSHPSHRTP